MSNSKEDAYIARDPETAWEDQECLTTASCNGARVLLDVLANEGVEVIFGYPGEIGRAHV